MQELIRQVESLGSLAPIIFFAIYLLGCILMLWRLVAMLQSGGTSGVLGLVLLPFGTALGNVLFSWRAAAGKYLPEGVFVNCLINNLTGILLLTGLIAVLWKVEVAKEAGGGEKPQKTEGGGDQKRATKLWILTALVAVLFFICLVWLMGLEYQPGKSVLRTSGRLRLDLTDAVVFLGTFLFWEVIYLVEALRVNRPEQQFVSWKLVMNLGLVFVGAIILGSTYDWLVDWAIKGPLHISDGLQLGFFSGLLAVVPNALIAFYFGWRKKPEIVYGVQAADGTVCIPFCLALLMLILGKSVAIRADIMLWGMIALGVGIVLQIMFLGSVGKLPRVIGATLVLIYVIAFGIVVAGVGMLNLK